MIRVAERVGIVSRMFVLQWHLLHAETAFCDTEPKF